LRQKINGKNSVIHSGKKKRGEGNYSQKGLVLFAPTEAPKRLCVPAILLNQVGKETEGNALFSIEGREEKFGVEVYVCEMDGGAPIKKIRATGLAIPKTARGNKNLWD